MSLAVRGSKGGWNHEDIGGDERRLRMRLRVARTKRCRWKKEPCAPCTPGAHEFGGFNPLHPFARGLAHFPSPQVLPPPPSQKPNLGLLSLSPLAPKLSTSPPPQAASIVISHQLPGSRFWLERAIRLG